MKLETLQDLYIEQLRDLFSAETQIIEALPKMIKMSSNQELKSSFERHLRETEEQRDRLEQIFNDLGKSPRGEKCLAMEGLIKEGEHLMKEDAEPEVLDAGLITAAQRIEHYEIAGYGTVCAYAELLGRKNDQKVLGTTLEEEKETDQLLNRIAMQVVNVEAL